MFQRGDPLQPDDAQEVLIPKDRNFADFTERMVDAIEALSASEKRTPVEVLSSVSYPSDILRFRVISEGSTNGVLPFVEGVDLYNGMKRALLAAACDELRPQSYHPRLVRKEADQYLAGCRLGQTMVGSYIATILCPIDPVLDDPKTRGQVSMFPELARTQTSFYRIVTARVMQSLDTIATRLSQGDAGRLIRPDKGDLQISGNFFEALSVIQPHRRSSSLDVTVSWSPTYFSAPDVPSEVEMLEEYFPLIDDISERLRPDFQPEKRRIVGKVIALYGEQNQENLVEGEVIIRFEDEGTLLEARAALVPKDYEQACDAHKLGKYVEIFGTLERLKRRYVVAEYQAFEVLPFFTSGTGTNKLYMKKAQQMAKRRRR